MARKRNGSVWNVDAAEKWGGAKETYSGQGLAPIRFAPEHMSHMRPRDKSDGIRYSNGGDTQMPQTKAARRKMKRK
jgi:hypothetical protein